MQRESIHELIKDVLGPNVYRRDVGGWVSIHCPLARWTHEKGADNSPSAGISVNNGISIFNCFTCHKRMPLHGLLRQYGTYTGEDFSDLIDEVEDEGYLGARTLPDWEGMKAANLEETLMPINEGIYMDLYDSAAGHPYLQERGISDETAQKLELLFDPEDPADGHPRILFPVRGPDGLLYGFSGRATSVGARLKVRDYAGLQKARCLLGAHLVANDGDKLLLVEGLFDYANAWEQGYPGAAVMHSTLTEAQAAIVRELGKPTYLFYDDDKAGHDGTEAAGKLIQAYVPTMRVRYPEVWIDDPREDGGGHWLKDPGELERDEFEGMIRDAILF
jgi:hypothetical protein